jgi:hypothetical protein
VADSCVQINENSVVIDSVEFVVTLVTTSFAGYNLLFCFSYVVETASLYKSTNQPPT